MKKRLHFYIVGGVLLIAIILGSFFDLQINAALFDRYNGFGLAISAFGMIPGYGTLTFLGGVLFALTFKNKQFPVWLRVIFHIVSVALYGVAVYFLGRDVFGVNGFESKQIFWLGFLIMGLVNIPIAYLGYWLGKKNTYPKMWIAVLVLGVAMFMALVPFTTLLKSIMHRPRYRIAVFENFVDFHNWWEPTKNYNDLISASAGALTKEEFKSYPSGHACATACSMIMLSYIPVLDKRLMKYQPYFFYGGFVWTLLMMFCRMLVGAHYLTDVAFGALITVIMFFIANEVNVRVLLKEESPVEEKPAEEPVNE